MVSEIHENVDLVLGFKNFVEVDAEMCLRELKFKFLKRSLPIFPVFWEMIKPRARKYVKLETPFFDELSR